MSEREFARALGAFVWLGVGLRLARLLLHLPLSRDEAKLASSLIDRGYADLMAPLDYGQVAPFGYLWASKAIVDALGVSELTLRLLPFVCGVAALFVMRRLATRALPDAAALLAVGLLACSYYPIRMATEAKPYATDLLAATGLLLLGWLAHREAGRPARLVALAIAGPIAILTSYPSVFVIGAVGLALAPRAWRSGWKTTSAWLSFVGLSAATFLLVFLRTTRGQYDETSGAMIDFWERSFPPLGDPVGFLGWFVHAHTGRTFGYPIGEANGGSLLTFVCFVIGAFALWRWGRRWLLALLLGPFALTFVAAALERYPYGGSGRITQHFVPSICLLAGVGLATLLARRPSRAGRRRALAWAAGVLVLVGLVATLRYAISPYQDEESSLTSREFARAFWTVQAADAELVCAVVDRPEIADWRGSLPHMHRYWVNQRIYFDRLHEGREPSFETVSHARPLRVAVPDARVDGAPDSELPAEVRDALDAWLDTLRSEYDQVGVERWQADGYRDRGTEREVWVELYEFVPKSAGGASQPSP